MGIIDKDAKVALSGDGFEATGDGGGFGEGKDALADLDSESGGTGDRGERVVDVKLADVWEANEVAFAFGIELVAGSIEIDADVTGPEIGSGADAVGEHGGVFFDAGGELTAVAVINIENGFSDFFLLGLEIGEELGLGLIIGVHCLMIIEVILGEIGKDGGVKLHPSDSGLIEGVGGDFHGDGLATGGVHLPEKILDITGFGGRSGGGKEAVADFVADSADETAASEFRFTDMLEEKGGGGFSVGTGDARDLERMRGIFIKSGGEISKSEAGIGNDNMGRFGAKA